MSRFEIVRTDAGWHARFRAANGRIVFSSEVYTRRRAATNAVELLAKTFGVYQAPVDARGFIWITGRDIQVRDVDERTTP